APGDISAEISCNASGGMVTRSSTSAAVEAGAAGAGGSTLAPLCAFLAGACPPLLLGIVTTFQRRVVLSSLKAKAVNTWVPSGLSGSAKVTGTLNTGSKPLRTNSLPSLRLMNTEIGPGLSGRGSAAVVLWADFPRRAFGVGMSSP